MTTFDRLEPRLPELFDELAAARVPDYVDDLLRSAELAPQRPAWSALERWLPMGVIARTQTAPRFPWRLALLLALVGLVAAAGLIASGARRALPEPFGLARNGSIVFHDAGGDIVTADAATGVVSPLISGDPFDVGPVMAPDGSVFAFERGISAGDPRPAVALADADGSDVRQLLGPDVRLDLLVWSPTGDRIVIHHDGERRDQLTVVSTTDGTATTIPTGIDVDAAWWRPGTEDLVVAGEDQLGTVAVDGTGYHPIIDDPSLLEDQMAVSPDGKAIAYSSWNDGAEGRIRIVDIDAATGRDAGFDPGVPFTDLKTMFFPDSKRLLIDRYEEDGYRPTILTLDGSVAPMPLGDYHRDGTDGSIWSISPDGTQVLVTYLDDDTTWLFDAKTGNGHRLDWQVQRDAWRSWQRLAQ